MSSSMLSVAPEVTSRHRIWGRSRLTFRGTSIRRAARTTQYAWRRTGTPTPTRHGSITSLNRTASNHQVEPPGPSVVLCFCLHGGAAPTGAGPIWISQRRGTRSRASRVNGEPGVGSTRGPVSRTASSHSPERRAAMSSGWTRSVTLKPVGAGPFGVDRRVADDRSIPPGAVARSSAWIAG
jgi:hypothetical protein